MTRFDKFVTKARQVHGNKYTYDSTTYVNYRTGTTITCDCGNTFSQWPNNHVTGKQGCPKCSVKRSHKATTLTIDNFIKKANSIHFFKYDYSLSTYSKYHTKISIKCNNCNTVFNQSPANHLQGHGCPDCGTRTTAKKLSLTKDMFIAKAKLLYGSQYDYSNISYIDPYTSITIKCNDCNTVFSKRPDSHIWSNLSGCPTCKSSFGGFNTNKPGTLYYLSINNGEAYKIGITNRHLNLRIKTTDRNKARTIRTWYYQDGNEALNAETTILQKFKKYKYRDEPILHSGNSELFSKDVLNLDTHFKLKDY